MRYCFVIIIFLLTANQLKAQREADNWLFGSKCWANFSSGQPQTVSQPLQNILPRGVACMSDKNGQLLFYADGQHVYNRLHQVMPQCVNRLMGTMDNAPNPVLTVPYPGHDSLYYLFYFEQDPIIHQGPFLRYAIINMKLQNGLGDLTVKDQLVMPATVCLKLTASLHCNKKDVWLIGHIKNSANYFSILLNSNGLNLPVFSAGLMIDDSRPYYNHQGPMKASPLGDKVASAFKGDYEMIELMDFNSQTGGLTNSKKLTITPPWRVAYTTFGWGMDGLEFSPTGKYLYASGDYISDSNLTYFPSLLYQFNTNLSSETAMQGSRYRIDSTTTEKYYGMQLANNGKLYVVSYNGNKMHVFNNPEMPGATSGFVRNVVDFGFGNTQYDLPYFLQSYLRYPMITTGNCQFQNIDFSIQNPVGISNIIWDFGDPASGINNTATSFTAHHIFSSQGSYNAKAILINSNGCDADTIHKTIHAGPFKVFLGNDTTICSGDTLRLKSTIQNASNFWSDGSIDTFLNVTRTGKYWIRVNLGECAAYDLINVTVSNLPAFTLGKDTSVCANQNVTLAPSPVPANASYQWSSGSTNNSITVGIQGTYWLKLTNNFGCVFGDTITIYSSTLPQFNLGADTALCQGVLSLNAFVSGASQYLWNTGEVTPNLLVQNSGIYWTDVTKDNCTYRDSIVVTFKPYPVFNLGPDTTLCESDNLLLDAKNTGATYQWQDGSTAQTYLVSSKGEYFVRVEKEGCRSYDTIYVAYSSKPAFMLGPDQKICTGLTVTLKPISRSLSGVTYRWQDGSAQTSYIATQAGQYVLTATNLCGSKSDTINIVKGICKLYVPTGFTPNGDGKNDFFKPSFGENIQNFRLQVFNRWGQQVFVSTDMNKGWDGMLNGIPQPQGIYTWLIRYNARDKQAEDILKGTVLLIR